MKTMLLICLTALALILQPGQLDKYEKDTFETSSGKLTLHFIGHGSLAFDFNGTLMYIDPSGRYADYSNMPGADIILITHHHGDHLDSSVIKKLSASSTAIILPEASFQVLKKGKILKNGEKQNFKNIEIKAVPAYNTTEGRDKYHPKGRDNGYVISFGGKKIYVAGDTENIPEMSELENIDIAFLPMNQPYTMTPGQVADAARSFRPKILYPYHYGDTDVNKLKELLNEPGIEIRLRKLK